MQPRDSVVKGVFVVEILDNGCCLFSHVFIGIACNKKKLFIWDQEGVITWWKRLGKDSMPQFKRVMDGRSVKCRHLDYFNGVTTSVHREQKNLKILSKYKLHMWIFLFSFLPLLFAFLEFRPPMGKCLRNCLRKGTNLGIYLRSPNSYWAIRRKAILISSISDILHPNGHRGLNPKSPD